MVSTDTPHRESLEAGLKVQECSRKVFEVPIFAKYLVFHDSSASKCGWKLSEWYGPELSRDAVGCADAVSRISTRVERAG
jgi:hypothetical protein